MSQQVIPRISSLDGGYKTGDLSIFPQALDDKRLLYQASNNSLAQLTQTLTYNGRIVYVDDTGGFPDNGQIRIGPLPGGVGVYELIAYNKKTPTTFQQLQRGFAGSNPNIWTPGQAYVTNSVVADHHNALKDAIVNLEHDLGVHDNPDPISLNGILKAQEVRFLAPRPLFRAFPIKGTPRLRVRFQNFTTGHIIRYLWDFGDGGTSLEKSPIHSYVSEGQYTVKLNVITSTGAQGIVTKNNYITVSADASLPFFYVQSISQPYSVQTATALTASGHPTQPKNFVFVDQTDGDIIQRNWIFGDSKQVTVNDPNDHTTNHIYLTAGSYVVTCLIIFSNGSLQKAELPEPLVVL